MLSNNSDYMVPTDKIMFPEVKALGFEEVGTGREYKTDVVIVGAGPGGGAAAKVFAESGYRVVVIESGPKASRFRPNYPNVAKYHMQENGSMVARGKVMMPIAAGKGVGGSTLINSALSFRTPDNVLQNWMHQLQDDEWSPHSLKPILDEVARIIGVDITKESVAGNNNKLIVEGINKLGLDGGLAPRSTPRCAGCGICYYGCPTGGKASTNLTYLPRASILGTIIQAETTVTEILVKNDRAIGVKGIAIDPETGNAGGIVTVFAKKVFLAAGAIGTPRLLWYSGLAEKLGPMVGKGLSVHPGSTLIGLCEKKVEMWKGATQGAYFHHPDLPGVLPHTFSAPPEACLIAAGYIGHEFQKGLSLLPYMCGMLVMVSDKGNGSVRATKAGNASISYDFDPTDVSRIKRGLIEVAKVLLAGGAISLRAPIRGIGVVKTAKELADKLEGCTIQDFTLYAAHPMGTCRMSLSANSGVINSNGETHNIKDLFISDASVFPTSIGVNPQMSTMACSTLIARKTLKTK
jgi:choline dehydrogenase-like flavoprotein